MDKNKVEQILGSHGFADFKWLNPKEDIVLGHWVRFKCMYGCSGYGKCGGCPPAVPSVDECHKMIRDYDHAVLLHFSVNPETGEQKEFSTADYLALEREVFIAGNYKAFILPHSQCKTCRECVAKDDMTKCVDNAKSRPGPDAMGIDLFATARKAGYAPKVAKTHDDITDRFSFLLID